MCVQGRKNHFLHTAEQTMLTGVLWYGKSKYDIYFELKQGNHYDFAFFEWKKSKNGQKWQITSYKMDSQAECESLIQKSKTWLPEQQTCCPRESETIIFFIRGGL